MTEVPLITVVVPCLNRRQFIRPTIESILSQDYPDVECIVVDGGSSDGTLDVIRSYEGRLSWISGKDSGPAEAINRGWQRSSGKYFSWLNADDVWLPDAVSTVVSSFRNSPELDVVYGSCGGIDSDGRLLWVAPATEWSLSAAILECDTVIYQPAAFMTREIVDRVGGLYPDWCHDHDLWIRIALAGGRFGAVDQQLANCRIWHGDEHNNPKIMVPALLRLINRTFANPALPESMRPFLKQTKSFAYARCLEYLLVTKPFDWLLAMKLISQGIACDPRNTSRILRHACSRVPIAFRRLANHLLVRYRPATRWRADAS
jgi:glycosyltransferase involved in cell wall biosynthesis